MSVPTLKNASPELARAAMLGAISELPTCSVGLGDALGRTLAQDIVANRDQPPFRASAMDGYGIISQGAPGTLKLIGQSAAGAGFAGLVQTGEAVRIFTGAPVPQGVDSVVIQEDVVVNLAQVTVPAAPLGQHIRAQGVDFISGTKLLSRGQRLDSISTALVAAAGCDRVDVTRKPVVAIMSGGDEIVSPGQTPGAYDVFDSISSGLSALIQTWGGDPVVLAPRRDSVEDLQAGFRQAFERADIVVTIGGASVGDRDLMKPSLAMFAPEFLVDKIAIRPGKPTWFAMTKAAPILGLPGNPASALVCAYLFLRPILAKMMGQEPQTQSMLSHAQLTIGLPANGPREHYLRATTGIDANGKVLITPCEQQDSSLLSVFQSANALLRLPANHPAMEAGALVEFIDLQRSI
jgi:molybdopterin molybdotransferase